MSDFMDDFLNGMRDGILGLEDPMKITSAGYMTGYNATCDDEDDEKDEMEE